jgi:hypothetical protein
LWIQPGAVWQQHRSFVPPIRPELPEVSDPAWCRKRDAQALYSRL